MTPTSIRSVEEGLFRLKGFRCARALGAAARNALPAVAVLKNERLDLLLPMVCLLISIKELLLLFVAMYDSSCCSYSYHEIR